MNTLHLLATAKLFYTHGFITFLIIGIIFTIVGYIVGKLAWRNCQSEAERIETANAKLERSRQAAAQEIASLEAKIDELEQQAAV